MNIFSLSYKKPITNEKVSDIYETDASFEEVQNVAEKIKNDSSPSSEKPMLLKKMLEMNGYNMNIFQTENNISF